MIQLYYNLFKTVTSINCLTVVITPRVKSELTDHHYILELPTQNHGETTLGVCI